MIWKCRFSEQTPVSPACVNFWLAGAAHCQSCMHAAVVAPVRSKHTRGIIVTSCTYRDARGGLTADQHCAWQGLAAALSVVRGVPGSLTQYTQRMGRHFEQRRGEHEKPPRCSNVAAKTAITTAMCAMRALQHDCSQRCCTSRPCSMPCPPGKRSCSAHHLHGHEAWARGKGSPTGPCGSRDVHEPVLHTHAATPMGCDN
jgi:hypothetical protein